MKKLPQADSERQGSLFAAPVVAPRNIVGTRTTPLPEKILKRAHRAGVQAQRNRLAFGGMGRLLNVLPNPDLVLKKLNKNINDYEDLLTDPQVYASLQSRFSGVAALEYGLNIDGAPSEQSLFVERVLADLDMSGLIREILQAIPFGVQFLEIYWQHRAGRIIPTSVVSKPREWFVFDGLNRPLLRNGASTQGELLDPKKFLVVQHNATYNNPYGEALLSRCYWSVQFKKNAMKFWVRFTEKYGMPYLHGKVGIGASEEDYDALYDDLDGLKQDGVVVTPDDANIAILEAAKSSSADLYTRLVEQCNTEITKAILSHNASTDAVPGKLGNDTTALQVRDDIVKSDRTLVEQTVNKLIRWIVDANFWETSEYPVWSMTEKQALDKNRAERDKLLADTKLVAFTKTYYQRYYGFKEDEIEIIPPQAAAPAPFEEIPASAPSASAVPAGSAPVPRGNAVPASLPPVNAFEEPDQTTADRLALDLAVQNAMNSDGTVQAMAKLQAELVKSVSAGNTYEEMSSLLAPLLGKLDTTKIEELLSNAVFAADMVGRLGVQTEIQAQQFEDNKKGWEVVSVNRFATFAEANRKAPQSPPAPTSATAWNALRSYSAKELVKRGLGRWDESGLMLLPKAWYNSIPDGYEVVDIFMKPEKFKRGTSSDDARFGFLSYGIFAGKA